MDKNPAPPCEKFKETILDVLKHYPDTGLCLVFGSSANRAVGPDSDVDIAVAFEKELDFDKKLSIAAELASALQREIDLVDLQQVSGHILQQILCTGEVILARDKTLYAGLIKKMWYNQADMMDHYNMILKKRRLKFIYG